MNAFRFALALCVAFAAAQACAADLPSLPTQAADPGLGNLGWKGWSFGAGVTAVARKGARGQFGGDTFVGFDHLFANDVTMSLRFDAGYAPSLGPLNQSNGFDFVAASAKTVFNSPASVRPFLVTSATVARGLTFANGVPLNPLAALNGVFNGSAPSQTLGAVGAGVQIDITPNVHVEVGGQVGDGSVFPLGF